MLQHKHKIEIIGIALESGDLGGKDVADIKKKFEDSVDPVLTDKDPISQVICNAIRNASEPSDVSDSFDYAIGQLKKAKQAAVNACYTEEDK